MRKMQIVSVVLVMFLTFSVGVERSYARVEGAISAASALGTGFTYQGQLKTSGGSPITSTCDFQFTLWDAASSGTQVGSLSTVTGVSVVNGYFTVQVNSGGEFGATAFNGEARWLQIAVRCPTGSGSYTTLSPLQPVTPAPYALALPGLYTQQGVNSPNVIGGYSGNTVTSGISGATISGGGTSGNINSVTGNFGTVSGGYHNTASFMYASVGGGYGNNASNSDATVGGGESNTANGDTASVGGGMSNTASGAQASVGGGYNNTAGGNYASVGGGVINTAGGNYATIPGGLDNTASGNNSFAAGTYADAVHSGAFVWADNTTTSAFSSTTDNQFLIKAAGGVGINTNATSANNLTVNGQIIAGGTAAPVGGEPFVSEGSTSGISMDDRAWGSYYRWVIVPNKGSLFFYNDLHGAQAAISSTGVLSIYLGNAGSTPVCYNVSGQLASCSSSLRYKNNVATLSLGLDTIASLRPVTFDWKGTGEHDLGFVAEEVDKVTPLLTTRNADGQIEGVKYDRISAVLVNAMQEQQKQITDLQAQVAALKQGSRSSSTASPFSTPWPWLALVTIVLGGLAITKRQGGRS